MKSMNLYSEILVTNIPQAVHISTPKQTWTKFNFTNMKPMETKSSPRVKLSELLILFDQFLKIAIGILLVIEHANKLFNI